MENPTGIRQKLGVDIGNKGDSRSPVIEDFVTKGVIVSPKSLPHLRSGRNSGERIKEREESAKVLEGDDASLKNAFYLQIAEAGVAEMAIPQYSEVTHTLKTEHFTDNVAKRLKVNAQNLRIGIRGMRADMVLAQPTDSVLVESFNKSAEEFIDAQRAIKTRFSNSPSLSEDFDQAWDHKTIENFYENLYVFLGGRAIGTWTPHEMEPLSLFYRQQIGGGNHLTPLDILLLKRYKDGQEIGEIIDDLRDRTHVEVDSKVLIQHRNLLVHGKLTS